MSFRILSWLGRPVRAGIRNTIKSAAALTELIIQINGYGYSANILPLHSLGYRVMVMPAWGRAHGQTYAPKSRVLGHASPAAAADQSLSLVASDSCNGE